MKQLKLHEILFYVFLFLLPIQTRILYNPESAYISWYFNYHLAFFVYLTDLILFTCFVLWFSFDKPKLNYDRTFWLILAFIAITLISLFHVKHIGLGLYQTIKWIEMLLLTYYVYTNFITAGKFQSAAWIIYISSLIQSLIGVVQFHVQHMVGLRWLGEYIAPLGTPGLATVDSSLGKIVRAYGTMSHPNLLGAFLVFGLFMGFSLVSHTRTTDVVQSGGYKTSRLRLVVVSCGTILIVLGIFVSFSRLAWLGAIIAFLAFGAYYLRKKQRKSLVLLALIGIVSCGTILIGYQPYLKARVLDTNTTSISDRYFFNTLGLKLFSHNPIGGVGAGNYIPAMKQMFNLDPWQYQPAHNIFIFVGTELGVIGLALFILVLWNIFREAAVLTNNILKFSLITLGLVFLLLGQFDHYFVTIQQGRLMFFTYLGLLAALPNLNYEKLN